MIDKKDVKIIEQLQKDGRISLRNIAKNLEMSPSTSSNRFHKLENQEIIESVTPDLNYQKIGYELTTITQIKAESGKTNQVYEKLVKLDFVRSVYSVTGETDIIVISKFKSRREMNKGAKTIRKNQEVLESKTNVVLESEEEINLPISED